ncbi:hypothetical protein PPERSA_11054 [Pseudocohnilembus persalinus]|uniref:Uncharacterized protein n=1 Tax=Pseudocohnilembus persalinus TaxID=266149 RepID=A0A0V0QZ91_PSEPJ|nr:hypothetical protein PPERSA_11054 [Pseudocohnilembus persalinus]|eukprot:KRX07505.1 hypothetical protein PPERSA_11054 [Pseudocohnilembus persalinus]
MEVEQQNIPQGNLELFQYENIYQTIPPNLDMNMDIQLQKSNIYIYYEKSTKGHKQQQQEDSINIYLATYSEVYQINIEKDYYELFKNAMVSVLYNYLQKKTEEKYVKGIILAKNAQLREMYDKFVIKNTGQQNQQQNVLNISEKDFWENCKDYQAYLNSQARTQVQKEFQKLKIQQNKQKPLQIDKENSLEYTIERGSQNLDQYYDDPYKSDIAKINQASIDLYQQQVHLDEKKLKQVNDTLKNNRAQSLKKHKKQQVEIQQHQNINNINNHQHSQLDGQQNQKYSKLEEIPQHAINFSEFKQNLNNLYEEYVQNPNILQMPNYREQSYQDRNKGFKSIYRYQMLQDTNFLFY